MDNYEEKTVKLRKIIIVLLVLLLLSGVALGASYIYRHLNGNDEGNVIVPQNVLEEADAVSERRQESRMAENYGDSVIGYYGSYDSYTDEPISGGSAVEPDTELQSQPQEQVKAAVLELYKTSPEINANFDVSGMLPGDHVERYFCVRIYHERNITLYFREEIKEELKALGDVLKIRLTDMNTGEVILCDTFENADGREFAESIKHSGKDEAIKYYKIEAWLDTSVDNRYADALLSAEFKWYVKDEPTGGGAFGEESAGEAGDNGLIAKTGDTVTPVLWCIFCICAAAMAVLILITRKKEQSSKKTRQKLYSSIGIAVLLSLMLSVTTYALITSIAGVEDNSFRTGSVRIDLNGGKPIFSEDRNGSHMNIEPGHTLKEDFYIRNEGTADAYYRIYLKNISGDLDDILLFNLVDENGHVLFSGTAEQFDSKNAYEGEEPLAPGESITYTMTVKMPEEAGNTYKNADITFDMSADAVQVRNNDGKEFE